MRRVKPVTAVSARTDAKPRRARRLPARRAGVALKALAVGLVVGVPLWAWASGLVGRMGDEVVAQAVSLSAHAGLRVEDVIVEGRQRTRPEHLLAALRVERGDAILGYDLAAAKQRVEGLPWITGAAIERRLPGEIRITIAERWPIAIWQHEGSFLAVDMKGKPIGDDVSSLAGLPLVVGEDAPAHAADLVAMLASEPELMRRVMAAVRVSGRRWNLVIDRLDGGIDVRLPEDNPAAAWKRLARLEREERLLERKLVSIDLRLPDRLILRKAGGAEETVPAAKKRKAGKDA